MACRGTGKVISNLGGTPKSIACPWCEGSGTRIAAHDTQSPWKKDGNAEGEPARAEGESAQSDA
jgi:hypothetical protein